MPELSTADLLTIARACGFESREASHDDDGIEIHCDCCDLDDTELWKHWVGFEPHADANDAVLAAERFGLCSHFGKNCTLHYNAEVREWWCTDNNRGTIIGRGTFCIAICRAILRLAKGETDND